MDPELERLVRTAQHGIPPAPAGLSGPPPVAGAADPEIFDPDAPEGGLSSLPTGARKFPIGEKVVWVHAVTPDEALYLNGRALQEVEQMRPALEGKRAALEFKLRARVQQALLCCRVSPALGAARVFRPEHGPKLRSTLPNGTLEGICALSDQIGQSEDLQLEAVRDFLSGMARWHGTLASRWSEVGETACREALTRCASSVSSLRSWTDLVAFEFPELPEPAAAAGQEAPSQE